MYDAKTTIQQFVEAAGAKQPTPGGGSATALVGALSAAMGEMVMNYTVGKKELAPRQAELEAILHEFQKARRLLLGLMEEDQVAYELLSRLQKLPAGAPERQEKFPAAQLACIRVPEAVGATAVAVLELCQAVVDVANFHLLSDLAVCADLTMATLRCAIYNVRVNLQGLTDKRDRDALNVSIGRMVARGTMLIQQVVPRIWQRFDQGI